MKTYTESSSMTLGSYYPFADRLTDQLTTVGGSGRHIGSETLVDSLYQHLDLQALFETIAIGLKKTYAIDGISFCSFEQLYRYESSRLSDLRNYFRVTFNILHNKQLLGSVSFFRSQRFSAAERNSIAALVKYFSGPLNNSLLYTKACHAANHDTLTGVYNRAALHSLVTSKLTSLRRQPLVLMICDLDRFKSINDNYGHATGDEVLQLFARNLKSVVRETDLVFRYGGDEFVIALPNTTAKGGFELAEKVRRSIHQSKLYVKRNCINLSATIGITEMREGDSLADAFTRADQAMLRGKKSGKNQVVTDCV